MESFKVCISFHIHATVQGSDERSVANELSKGVSDILKSMGALDGGSGTVEIEGTIERATPETIVDTSAANVPPPASEYSN